MNILLNLLHCFTCLPSLVMLYKKTPLTDFALAGSSLTLSHTNWNMASLFNSDDDNLFKIGCIFTDFKSTYAPKSLIDKILDFPLTYFFFYRLIIQMRSRPVFTIRRI